MTTIATPKPKGYIFLIMFIIIAALVLNFATSCQKLTYKLTSNKVYVTNISSITWQSNTTYYFKAGTTISQPLNITGNNITIDSFGSGTKPIFTGVIGQNVIRMTGNNNTVQNIQVITNDSTVGCGIQIVATYGRTTVKNCTVKGGEAGINCSNTNGSTYIYHCEVSGAWGDGMYNNNNDTLYLIGCYFHDMLKSGTNKNSVDCCHSQQNRVVFMDSCISDHHNFPGKYTFICNIYDTCSITNSTFHGAPDNGALYPGGKMLVNGVYSKCRYHISNCKIIGGLYGLQNNATRLYCDHNIFIGQTYNAIFEGGGNEYITNCDFINQAIPVRAWNDTVRLLQGNIFYGFTDPFAGHVQNEMNNCFYHTSDSSHLKNYIGTGYILANPLFNSDYSLQSNSPCIGLGAINIPYSPLPIALGTGVISAFVTPKNIYLSFPVEPLSPQYLIISDTHGNSVAESLINPNKSTLTIPNDLLSGYYIITLYTYNSYIITGKLKI